jgi:hypothetical protein
VIDYPRLDSRSSDLPNKHAAFHWFVGNKQIQGTGGIGVKPVIDQVLPNIDAPRLKKIRAEIKRNSSKEGARRYPHRQSVPSRKDRELPGIVRMKSLSPLPG